MTAPIHKFLPWDMRAVERRLSQRVFFHWLVKCGARDFARLQDIEPQDLGVDWDWCFVIDVERSIDFPFFNHLGTELSRFSNVLLSGRSDWTHTVLDKATEKFREALADRGPILVEDELQLYDGRRLLFRSIMLPLSDDQRNINYLLGAANGKLVEEKAA